MEACLNSDHGFACYLHNGKQLFPKGTPLRVFHSWSAAVSPGQLEHRSSSSVHHKNNKRIIINY